MSDEQICLGCNRQKGVRVAVCPHCGTKAPMLDDVGNQVILGLFAGMLALGFIVSLFRS